MAEPTPTCPFCPWRHCCGWRTLHRPGTPVPELHQSLVSHHRRRSWELIHEVALHGAIRPGDSDTADAIMAAVAGGCKGIFLTVDSHGGSGAAAATIAGTLYALRGRVPSVAWIRGGGALSAGLRAAVGATLVFAAHPHTPTGSIGAMFHTCLRGRIVMITAPDGKGAQGPPMPPSFLDRDPDAQTIAELQGEIDADAEAFLASVAEYRGVNVDTLRTRWGGAVVSTAARAHEDHLIDGLRTESEARGVLTYMMNTIT